MYMQIIVDGLLTNYVRQGEGRAVVLLHGWGDNSKSWLELAQELAKNFDVIIPDLPGFGGSQLPPSTWGLNDYGSFMSAFLQKIKVREVYCLIGHSNGGAIALRAIAQNLISSQKLVLLSSAGIRGEAKGRLKVLSYAAKTGKLLTTPLPESTKNKLRAKAYKTIGSDMLVAEDLQETFKKIVSDDVQADAKIINIPTLLVYGEGDEQTPVRYGEIFHELIDYSSLEVLPEAGHFLQLDRPNALKSAIEGFIG
jgi:pimeloyl-ACP methyl ester carboxylesterase